MCTVKHPDFSLLKRIHVIRDDHRKACLIKRQFIKNLLITLNDPRSIDFAGIEQLVSISELFKYRFCLILR